MAAGKITFQTAMGIYFLLQLDGSASEYGIEATPLSPTRLQITGTRDAIESFRDGCLAARHYCYRSALVSANAAIRAIDYALSLPENN